MGRRQGRRVYPPKVIDIVIPVRDGEGKRTGEEVTRRFEVHRDESVIEIIRTGGDDGWKRTRRSRVRDEKLRLSVIFHLLRAMGRITDDDLAEAARKSPDDGLATVKIVR